MSITDNGPAARHVFPALLGCFLLTGVAGLVYQIAWSQQFALVFGSSQLAAVTVLAAFMGGLSLGAALAARWRTKIRRPLATYALLEAGVAVWALAMPWLLDLVAGLQVTLLGGRESPPFDGAPESVVFNLLAAFALLAVPTAMMGASLPLLVRHSVHTDAQIGPRVALLYSLNTCGAAIGAMVAAFVLLPRLGLAGAIWCAVACNLLAALGAALLRRSSTGAVTQQAAGETSLPPGGRVVLVIVTLSGYVSFSLEVLWSRLLTHLVGGSIYALGAMLASFLTGIAIGSALASRLAPSRARARIGFVIAQVGVAALSLAAFAAASRLPELVFRWTRSAPDSAILPAVVGGLVLLPAAICIGATYPLSVRLLARHADDATRASALSYSWSTVGAIVGAVATGFVVLPTLRFVGTITLAAALSLACATVISLAVPPRRARLGGLCALAVVAVVVVRPAAPWPLLMSSPNLPATVLDREVVHYGVGRSATVLATDQIGEWRLASNGLPESTVQPPGGRLGRHAVARWLSLLPLVTNPNLESMLVVGLGAGVTLEEVPPTLRRIHVAELEAQIVEANHALAARRRADPLADPRVQIIVNDARNALRLTELRYDAIVSQPSHPWTVGSSQLFTREFFEIVEQHLEPGGAFVQWIGLDFVDPDLLRSLLATLRSVFPYVEIYQPPPAKALLFLCSTEPWVLESSAATALAAAPDAWRGLGVLDETGLVTARLVTSDGVASWAEGADLNTDWRNRLQTHSSRTLGRSTRTLLRELLDPLDPLPGSLPPRQALAAVRHLVRAGDLERAGRLVAAVTDPSAREVGRAQIALAAGQPRLGASLLRRAATGDESTPEALYPLLSLFRTGLTDRPWARGVAGLDRDPAAAMIETWREMEGPGTVTLDSLDARLRVEPAHPAFISATRLRVALRLRDGSPARLVEAERLLTPLLGTEAAAEDLLFLAELSLKVGRPRVTVTTLHEVLQRLPRAGRRDAAARQANQLFRHLPFEYRLRHRTLGARLAASSGSRRATVRSTPTAEPR